MASGAVPYRTFKFDRDYYSTHIPRRPIPEGLFCSGSQSLHPSRSSSRRRRPQDANRRDLSRGGNGRVVKKIIEKKTTTVRHLNGGKGRSSSEEDNQNTGLDSALLQVLQAHVRPPEMKDTLQRNDIQDHPPVLQAQAQVQNLALIIPPHLPPQVPHRRPTAIQGILQLVAVVVVLFRVLHLHPKLAAADLNVGPKSTILELYCRIRRLFVLPLPFW
nr:expressed protein [Hymenolepis microstoma]